MSAPLFGRWRHDPEFWLELEYRKRRQAFGSWGKGGGYFMGAPHQALLMASGAGDPYFSSVVLLINPSGSNGSTTFTDLSPVARTLTTVGGAQHDTSITKFTSSSMKFDGSSDNITAADSNDWDFPSKATLEVWVYPTTVSSLRFILSHRNVSGTNPAWFLDMNSSGKVVWNVEAVTVVSATSTNSLSINTWSFVQVGLTDDGALGGSPNTRTHLYINNSFEAELQSTLPSGNGNGLLYIATSSGEAGSRDWQGNLGPTRITKGVLRSFALPLDAFPTS